MATHTRQDAIDLISAAKAADGNGWIYRADETDEWYRITDAEIDDLRDLLNSADEDIARDAYSHWCSATGECLGNDDDVRGLGLIDHDCM